MREVAIVWFPDIYLEGVDQQMNGYLGNCRSIKPDHSTMRDSHYCTGITVLLLRTMLTYSEMFHTHTHIPTTQMSWNYSQLLLSKIQMPRNKKLFA